MFKKFLFCLLLLSFGVFAAQSTQQQQVVQQDPTRPLEKNSNEITKLYTDVDASGDQKIVVAGKILRMGDKYKGDKIVAINSTRASFSVKMKNGQTKEYHLFSPGIKQPLQQTADEIKQTANKTKGRKKS